MGCGGKLVDDDKVQHVLADPSYRIQPQRRATSPRRYVGQVQQRLLHFDYRKLLIPFPGRTTTHALEEGDKLTFYRHFHPLPQ